MFLSSFPHNTTNNNDIAVSTRRRHNSMIQKAIKILQQLQLLYKCIFQFTYHLAKMHLPFATVFFYWSSKQTSLGYTPIIIAYFYKVIYSSHFMAVPILLDRSFYKILSMWNLFDILVHQQKSDISKIASIGLLQTVYK